MFYYELKYSSTNVTFNEKVLIAMNLCIQISKTDLYRRVYYYGIYGMTMTQFYSFKIYLEYIYL